jgi:hypothetical protein
MGGCGGASGKGSKNGKSSKDGKGKGQSKGESKKGKGMGKPAGGDAAGQSIAQLAKQTAQNAKQMGVLQTLIQKVLVGSTPKAGAPANGTKEDKYWTCLACGDERCFLSRKECHRCSVPRAGAPVKAAPPKAAAAKAEAEPMDLTEDEVPATSLEDQIAEREVRIKAIKGLGSSWGQLQLEAAEAELKSLKEQQKRARPLPARLQAATARLLKARELQEENNEVVQNLQDKLAAALTVQTEVAAKVSEAEAELQAVTELAAVGSATSMACQTAGLVGNVLGAMGLNLDPVTIEAVKGAILQHFNAAAAMAGATPQKLPPKAPGLSEVAAGGVQGQAAAGHAAAWTAPAAAAAQAVAVEKAKREQALSAAKAAASEHAKLQAAADAVAAKAKAAAAEAEQAAVRQAMAEAEVLRQAAVLQPQQGQQQGPQTLPNMFLLQRGQEQQQQEQVGAGGVGTAPAPGHAAGSRGKSSSRSRERKRREREAAAATAKEELAAAEAATAQG